MSGDWDSPVTIGDALPKAPLSWDSTLEKFAETTGIDLKGKEPEWYMVSSYG